MSSKLLWAIVIFGLISSLWFWSRNGATTDIRVVRKGNIVSSYIDANYIGSAEEVGIHATQLIARVGYDELDNKYFNTTSLKRQKVISLPQGDYDINFKLQNPYAARLHFYENLLGDDFDSGPSYTFAINAYRHVNAGWSSEQGVIENDTSNGLLMSEINALKWIAWMLLRPFPYIVGLIGVWLVFYVAGNKFTFLYRKNSWIPNVSKNISKRLKKILTVSTILIIAVASIWWSRHLMVTYLKDAPHVPDAIHYLLISKMIAAGGFSIPLETVPQVLDPAKYVEYFQHWFVVLEDRIIVAFLAGHPLVLAIGSFFHKVEFVPPIIGAFNLLLVYYITHRLTTSFWASILSMIVLFISPFFQTQTIDYMSHNTTTLFILLALVPFLHSDKRLFVLTGFSLGMILNMRPLAFVAVSGVMGLMLVVELILSREFKFFLMRSLYIVAGLCLPIGLYFWYNNVTTGSVIGSPYSYHGKTLSKTIFGTEFTLINGLLRTFTNLAVFSLYYLKNYLFSFGPLLLSLLIVSLTGRVWKKIAMLQLVALSLIFVWTIYDGNFFMYGPRYIYEAVPILSILFGVVVWQVYVWSSKNILQLGFFVGLVGIVMFNLVYFELQWLGHREPEYKGILYVPSQIQDLTNFNFAHGKFADIPTINDSQGQTIYLMQKCEQWWCTGEGVWKNEFPLNEADTLFLTMPDDYNNTIPNAVVIDWEKFAPSKGSEL